MQFGYFTLSDNHYENNPCTANQLVADIIDEAVYAETVIDHPPAAILSKRLSGCAISGRPNWPRIRCCPAYRDRSSTS